MSKIYTKTGDKGKTSLFNGQRVLKSNDRVDAYGTVDELNSEIGLARSLINGKQLKALNLLLSIQQDLFEIGSALANPQNSPLLFLKKQIAYYEKAIDEMTEELPPLRNFILPGGARAGAQLHLARTVARRAERRIVTLAQKESIDVNIICYLNRLSDFLFTMARYINFKEKQKEIIWKTK